LQRILCTSTVVLAVLLGMAVGSLSAQENPEIAHLLNFVASSQCRFMRNGKWYGAEQGREHLERKYGHIEHRIRDADDFIEIVASESSITGRAYRVRCGDREMPTARWLKEELQRFRKSGP
jgi:hypothetical protein